MKKRILKALFRDVFSFRRAPKLGLVLACAVVSGFVLAAAYGQTGLTSFPMFALGAPQGWKDMGSDVSTCTEGQWPSWLTGRHQETRIKSRAASSPAIAVVIDDLGADAGRTRQA